MNPSTALATVCVDELLRCGVRDVVVCPGSRSGPLALAFVDAAEHHDLTVHVRTDERSAGFLALGLAKVSGSPAVVLTTSGTAVANLLPAIVEASYSGVPVVALTADRPPELHGVGANQTIDQLGIFGDFVRDYVALGPIAERVGENAHVRSTICRAVARATGTFSGQAGPVHVNVALREPLVPDGTSEWPESLEGRPDREAWTTFAPAAATTGSATVSLPARTLVVVGDCEVSLGRSAARLAEEHGWPLVSEPSGNAAYGTNCISTAGWWLSDSAVWSRLRPEQVLVVGRPTVSRAVLATLSDQQVAVSVVANGPTWVDVLQSARHVLPALPTPDGRHEPDQDWLDQWRREESAARRRLDDELDEVGEGEQHAVRGLYENLPSDALLIAGSSLPIRHVFLGAAPRDGVTVVANRGAAGIDGTVSTAVGAALAWQRGGGGLAVALVGDLTFLHDVNGLTNATKNSPRLTFVVLNNDGGGIFELLEPASSVDRSTFESVYGTPHGVDLAALCGAHGVAFTRVTHTKELLEVTLDPRAELQVVELRADREVTAETHRRLARAISAGR